MDFKENLIQLRKKANLSQEQLADKLSVTRQAISKWESGQTMPEADKILLLSDIFNVTTDRLLKGTEDSQKHKKEGADFFPFNGLYFINIAGNRRIYRIFCFIYGYLVFPVNDDYTDCHLFCYCNI